MSLPDRSERNWRHSDVTNGIQRLDLASGPATITSASAITPPEAEKLDQTLDDFQPRIPITELLNDVHRMTGFADKFTELRSGRSHKNPNAVLAAVPGGSTRTRGVPWG